MKATTKRIELDCEAWVTGGMHEGFLRYFETPNGRLALGSAKALHADVASRQREVLKTYSLTFLYTGLCVAYGVHTMPALCELVSDETTRAIKRRIERFVDRCGDELLDLLTPRQRERLAALVGGPEALH